MRWPWSCPVKGPGRSEYFNDGMDGDLVAMVYQGEFEFNI